MIGCVEPYDLLQRHFKRHSEAPKSYRCDKCGYDFRREDGLKVGSTLCGKLYVLQMPSFVRDIKARIPMGNAPTRRRLSEPEGHSEDTVTLNQILRHSLL